MTSVPQDRPREKALEKGVSFLSTTELLQVIIGSGNAQASVSRIARKVQRILDKKGSGVAREQLSEVLGLGPARVSQLLAVFELASRYPSPAKLQPIDTYEKALAICGEVRESTEESVVALTLDGGYRQIAMRRFIVSGKHPTELLRSLFADVARDNASKLIVAIGSQDRSLEPTLFDLSFARDLRVVARMFHVTVRGVIVMNEHDERVLKVS